MRCLWMMAIAAAAGGMMGCGSDVDPAITSGGNTVSSSASTGAGGGQGGTGGTAQGGMGGMGQGGMGQGGQGGTCLGCSDVVLQGGDPTQLCMSNGPPSSAQIYADFNQCVCVDSCSMECGNFCQGQMPSQQCQQCIGGNCGMQAQTCVQDGGMSACSTCADLLQGNGDPNNLCMQSQQAFDNLIQCACVTGCSNECGNNVCMGQQPSQQCQGCVGQTCGTELQACFMN